MPELVLNKELITEELVVLVVAISKTLKGKK